MNAKQTKLMTAAVEAKKAGYEFFTSIVKSYRGTTYYHVVSIDRIIANGGKWIAAPMYNNGWHGRLGVTAAKLPDEKHINKSDAIKQYC